MYNDQEMEGCERLEFSICAGDSCLVKLAHQRSDENIAVPVFLVPSAQLVVSPVLKTSQW